MVIRPRTWLADWEGRRRGVGCPMCAEGRPDETEYGVRVFAGRRADAYLQRTDVQRGYTIVVWRGRHVAEPTELTPEEARQLLAGAADGRAGAGGALSTGENELPDPG